MTFFSYTASEMPSILRYHKYGISYFLSVETEQGRGWVKVIPLREVC